MDVMQEVNIMQLHAAFPKLGVDTVDDVLKECKGNVAEARARIQLIFGGSSSGAVMTPVQSPARNVGIPWSPVPGVQQAVVGNASKDANVLRTVPDCDRTPGASKHAHRAVEANSSPGTPLGRPIVCAPVPMSTNIASPERLSPAQPAPTGSLPPSILASLMPPAAPAPTAQPAPSPEPDRRRIRPPLPLPVPLDPEPLGAQTPAPPKKPVTVPAHLQYLLLPSPQPAAPTPAPVHFEPGGWEEEDSSAPNGAAPQPVEAADACPAAHSQPPAAGLKAGVGDELGPQDESSNLEFVQGMFSSMDVTLVADVMRGVNNNMDAAVEKLLALQNIVDHTELLDSSSGSDDGSASSSLLASKQDSGSANDGQPWDVSGVPVDYTFKDLTDEQKVVLIRRELPGCSVEEAMNSLEACGGNVDGAIAVLSQAYERKEPEADSPVASAEVLQLKELYPEVDDTTLGNVYAAASKNVDVTKKMLEESGLVPFEAAANSKKPTSALFSQPAAAEVCAPTQQATVRSNGRPHGFVRRSDAINQELYEVQRAEARFYKADRARKLADAQKAWQRRDYLLANQLRDRADEAREKMIAASGRAGRNIFREKNMCLQNNIKVDVHGLHVHEAIEKTENVLRVAQGLPSKTTLQLITGKGLHSQDNIAKLRPAVIDYLTENNLHFRVDGGSIYVDVPYKDDDPPDMGTYYYQDAFEHG